MKEAIKSLSLKIPTSQWRWLRKNAFDQEMSVNGMVKKWIAEKMEKENAEKTE